MSFTIKLIMNDSIIEISSNPGIYNLLDFTNGKDTLIADAELSGGSNSQIRLILGDNNSRESRFNYKSDTSGRYTLSEFRYGWKFYVQGP